MKLNIDRLSLHYALRLAISCTIMVGVYQLLHLDHGYWAAFSVLGCIFPTSGQTFRRIKQRIAGTFCGMILGILTAHLVGNHWLYLDIMIPLFVFLTVYLKAFNYTFYALFNTIISVALVCLIVPGDWHIALTRMEMTLLGCCLALAATYWVFPNRVSDTLDHQIQQLRVALKFYFLSIAKLSNDSQSKASVFEVLQKTKSNLQEITHETWRVKSDASRVAATWQIFEAIYQSLLLLELEFPRTVENPELDKVLVRLRNIMLEDIDRLFDSATRSDTTLEALQSLLKEVTALRAIAAHDISIPIATFEEHIRLTESLKQLLDLTALLASCGTTLTPV